jgi:hypothetical protein
MEAAQVRNEEASPSAKKPRFQISALLPIVAFCMSLFSLYTSEVARRDVGRLDVIKTDYGLFHELSQLQLQYPQTAHLFTNTTQTYELTAAMVKASSISLSDQERVRMQLQERAVAHYFFTTYEEAFYLWTEATSGTDKHRAELARDDLAYFNGALCSNPRLLWYWDFRGGKLDRLFAEDLREYFKTNVPPGCQAEQDASGPFAPKGE